MASIRRSIIHGKFVLTEKGLLIEDLDIYQKTNILIFIRFLKRFIKESERRILSIMFKGLGSRTKSPWSIIMALRKTGVKGVYFPPVFPMDTSRPKPDSLIISQKPIAEAAGLGLMGLNRLVLHPEWGSSVCFTTILIDKELDQYDEKISKNPCLDCKLCVAACPVGAIKSTGEFDWVPCMVHNYREVCC